MEVLMGSGTVLSKGMALGIESTLASESET